MPSPEARKEPYAPVNCDFTDELEFVAVRKIPVAVSHWSEKDQLVQSEGRIMDIETTAAKEEFLVMSGGERVRLDHIQEIKITAAPNSPAPRSSYRSAR